MIGDQILTGAGNKAPFILTNPVLQLFFAGGLTEVCGGTPYVVDITLKVGHGGDELRFLYAGFDAS
jgi:hypothetical protein